MGKFNYFYYKEKRFDKFTLREQEGLVFDLINAFSMMKTTADMAMLMQDLLTEREVRNLAKRLRIAKLFLAGKGSREIIQELHCSAATVSKIKMWLDNAGVALKKVINKLPERRKVYRPKSRPGIGYGLDQILLHYGSQYLEQRERKRLEQFLESMRVKSARDRDFRREISKDFQNSRHRRSKA